MVNVRERILNILKNSDKALSAMELQDKMHITSIVELQELTKTLDILEDEMTSQTSQYPLSLNKAKARLRTGEKLDKIS